MDSVAPCLTWKEVITRLTTESAGAVVRVATSDIEHPLHAGMSPAVTENIGQQRDYLRILGEQTGCHVRDFGDYYDVRLYALPKVSLPVLVDPPQSPALTRRAGISSVVALPREEPGATVLATTALGSLIGVLIGGKKGAAAGALIGGGAGLAAVGVSSADSSPQTAVAAQALFQGLATTALARQPAVRLTLPATPTRPALPTSNTGSPTSQPKSTRRPTTKK